MARPKPAHKLQVMTHLQGISCYVMTVIAAIFIRGVKCFPFFFFFGQKIKHLISNKKKVFKSLEPDSHVIGLKVVLIHKNHFLKDKVSD